jgi:tetratricopeptide (TPR) repeat protein
VSENDFKLAVVHFQHSIQLQPDYAASYAALSLTLNYGGLADMKPTEVRDAARFAARRALELDPDSPLALSAMAEIQWTQDWDWDAAGRSYSRAVDLSMHSLDECGCYIAFLFQLGRSGEATALAERYVSLNPLSPFAHALYGSALAFARNPDLAIPHLRRALEANPRYYLAARRLASVYEESGQPQEALPVLDRPAFRASAALGELYARLGRRSEALRIDETLAQTGVDLQGRSLIYFALGDKDRAFGLLRQAVDQRQPYVNGIAFDPAFDDVRSDPRFQELIARFKLPSRTLAQARGPTQRP